MESPAGDREAGRTRSEAMSARRPRGVMKLNSDAIEKKRSDAASMFTPSGRQSPKTSTKPNRRSSIQSLHKIEANSVHKQLKPAHWTVGDYLLGTKTGHSILLFLTANILFFGGAVTWKLVGGNESFGGTWAESFWFSWGVFFDPGTQMAIPGGEEHKFKIVAVVFSIAGFTFNLLMLGIVVEGARVTLDSWKKGRSRIVATGHTLILGWSEKTLFLLKELACAAEDSGRKGRIVILAQEDAHFMKTEVRMHFPRRSDRRHISFREGCPHEVSELTRVSASSAANIIVLGQRGSNRSSDLRLIRTTVALASLPQRPSGAIVAEVRHAETSHIIHSILENAHGVIAREAINRVMCLMAVEPAIGHCYEDLISFVDGNELYSMTLEVLKLQGSSTFGQACQAFKAEAICIGVTSANGVTTLAPEDDLALEPADHLMIIARSTSDILSCSIGASMAASGQMLTRALSNPLATSPSAGSRYMEKQSSNISADQVASPFAAQAGAALEAEAMPRKQPQTIIMIGFPTDIGDFAHTLDFYLAPGSVVHILSAMEVEVRERRLKDQRANATFQNLKLKHSVGETTNIHQLRALPLAEASAIIVMADDSEELEEDAIDSQSLATVITLDSLLKSTVPRPKLICEVLDAETERMLSGNDELTQAATFFHSNALETGMFSLASSTPDVFNALLMMMQPEEQGSIAAQPIELYIREEELISAQSYMEFWELHARVRQRGELLVGWQLDGSDRPVLNPPKNEPVHFSKGDSVLVLLKDGIPTDTLSPTDTAVPRIVAPHSSAEPKRAQRSKDSNGTGVSTEV